MKSTNEAKQHDDGAHPESNHWRCPSCRTAFTTTFVPKKVAPSLYLSREQLQGMTSEEIRDYLESKVTKREPPRHTVRLLMKRVAFL